jgi:ribosomal protein L37AE/L43A
MEKYGVTVEEPPKEAVDKSKKEEPTCPECAKELEKDANVRKCPKHGTKPFEK